MCQRKTKDRADGMREKASIPLDGMCVYTCTLYIVIVGVCVCVRVCVCEREREREREKERDGGGGLLLYQSAWSTTHKMWQKKKYPKPLFDFLSFHGRALTD